jgi:hypothetical protein
MKLEWIKLIFLIKTRPPYPNYLDYKNNFFFFIYIKNLFTHKSLSNNSKEFLMRKKKKLVQRYLILNRIMT